MPELLVESGPWAGRSFTFDRAVVVGRGEVADLRVDEVTASRRHAQLRPSAGGWEVEDLGSANGTALNGQRLSAAARLSDGDLIVCGQLELRFRSAMPAAVAEPVSTTPAPADANPGGRLFQDLLSRVRLFCDLGAMGAERHSPEERALKALGTVLLGFPLIDRAALFVHVPVGDSLSLLGQATRDGRPMQPTAVVPLAREGLRHQTGLLLLDEHERTLLTERLRMAPLFGACASFPVRFSGELVGVMYLDSLKDNQALRPADRETLVGVAGMLGCLVAPLREPKRDYQVERHDLTLARRIQQRFLPQTPPTLTGYAIVDNYMAARVIGGDHYDFLPLADGRLALVVADVSGKALSGALYMARLGAVLKQAAMRTRRASDLLDEINRLLYADLEAGMFVTMLVAVLEPRTGAMEMASAGHPSPLVRRRGGKVETFEVPGGPPLGAMSEPTYEVAKHTLAAGECLLLYTDGLDEAHSEDSKLFGLERVGEALTRSEDAKAAIANLREDLARFVGNEPQSDDLTMVAIQRL